MEKERISCNIEVSPEIAKIINETQKGTNLSRSDVVEMIIKQYFASKRLVN